jgi:hypothetical protein
MDLEPLMIAVPVETESTVSLNSDPTITKDLPKRIKQYQDPTEVSFAEDVLNPELLEHSFLKKSKPLNVLSKLPKNDLYNSLLRYTYKFIK